MIDVIKTKKFAMRKSEAADWSDGDDEESQLIES